MDNKPWFMYDVVVPFGNVNYDVALGGSHDLDIGCPPNYEITALLDGNISSLSSPMWGKQVGVLLKTPYNGKKYCAYLHLSAVNPSLRVGTVIKKGDLIGWCGGGTTKEMYQGTTNPTGSNFLNDTFNSSRIQTGFALMDGIEYGKAGWVNFPPVDWSLNPTQIILDARKEAASEDTWKQQATDVWNANTVDARINSGIAQAWFQVYKKYHISTPITKEFETVDWQGNKIMYQVFASSYHIEWRDGHAYIYRDNTFIEEV